MGHGNVGIVGAAILAGIAPPHQSVASDQRLLPWGQIPLLLGDLGQAPAVIDAIPPDDACRAVLDAFAAPHAHLLCPGGVKCQQAVGDDLSDHEKAAVFRVDHQSVHPGDPQPRSDSAMTLRQRRHIRKGDKRPAAGLLQIPARPVQDLAHHHMVVRHHGIFADIGTGVLPGVIGKGAHNDALGIRWDPLPVPAGQELPDLPVVAHPIGADLIVCHDLRQGFPFYLFLIQVICAPPFIRYRDSAAGSPRAALSAQSRRTSRRLRSDPPGGSPSRR